MVIAASTKAAEDDRVERQLELDAKLVLMKLVDGMIHNSSGVDVKGLRLEYFISTMRNLIHDMLQPAFSDPTAYNMVEMEDIASLLILHLEIFKTTLQPDHDQKISQKESSSLIEVLIGTSSTS